MIIEEVRLHCTVGGARKAYYLRHEWFNQDGNESSPGTRYVVEASYGRIGGSRTSVIKYDGPHYSQSGTVFDTVRDEKLRKGYVVIASPRFHNQRPATAPPTASQPAKRAKQPKTRVTEPAGPTVEFYDSAPRYINI